MNDLISSLRSGVGHVHKTGDATCRRRCAFSMYVGFMSQSRVTEVYMIVYYSRHHPSCIRDGA